MGCDCIEKLCKPNGPIVTVVQKQTRKLTKARKLASLAVRVEATKVRLAAEPKLLSDRLSPWGDGKGGRQTVRQQVEFLLECGGAKGRTDACKLVEGA